ncbi:MAG: IS1634 family transposase [Candidatus Hydrothermarchaeota archaeon]
MFIKRSWSQRGGNKHVTYQIAESYRNEAGKPRQRILLHLGSADRFLEKDVDNLINGLLKVKGLTLEELDTGAERVASFGQIWALIKLWKDLKLTQAIAKAAKGRRIKFDLEGHIKSLVFNRLDDPGSKLRLLTWLEAVYIPGVDRENIRYEYLLRGMDFLIENKRIIEDKVAGRLLTLFDTEVKVCLYDITSSYFEAEASLVEDDIRQKGYSRDKRWDREQILVGIVMTKEGLPLAHYVFSGNTVDSATLQEVTEDIRSRFGVEKVTIVADKGMVLGDNLKFLVEGGQEFILGESARKTKVAREVIAEASEKRKREGVEEEYVYTAEKEKVTKVNIGDKKRQYKVGLRYVACYNPKVAFKKYQTRTARIAEALDKIEEIKQKEISLEDQYSQIQGYLKRKHLSRFFRVKLGKKEIRIEQVEKEIVYEKEADGWFVVITTDRKTGKQAIIARYKDLKYVEHGFMELKHSLELRPDFHWTEKRIRAHVFVCFLAFQLAVLFEKRLEPLKLSWEKAMEKLKRIQVIEWEADGRARQALVKTRPAQMQIFKAVGTVKPTLASL